MKLEAESHSYGLFWSLIMEYQHDEQFYIHSHVCTLYMFTYRIYAGMHTAYYSRSS
jgi:hypothetical protein